MNQRHQSLSVFTVQWFNVAKYNSLENYIIIMYYFIPFTFSQENTFTDEYNATTEINVFKKSVEVDGKDIKLDIDSFANIKSFFDRIRQYSNRCILPVLVGNKIDTADDRAIGKLLAEDFANEHDIPYIETSAKDGTMVNELFEKVLRDIINPSEEVILRQWRPFTSADLNSCKSCKCTIS
ncbi:RAB1A [Mytilus coruscus]|uniref:RAB1A n=1 Tax=Mytilus coruscus TaxID=42192 RepID=A0A6J8EDJ2_MYTCO|nr:RAB1A [Mytilus coruscus]